VPDRNARRGWLTALAACALLGAGAASGESPQAPSGFAVPAPAPAPMAAQVQPAPPPAAAPRPRPAPVKIAQAPKAEAKPTWGELNAQQQQALGPLSGTWSGLTEAHKRKWLAVSQNYPTMPPGEQARLHSRMAEWAALSPQQRTQARLNFAETQALPTDDKKAKWEAYQALPAEEKRKLAAGAAAAKPPAPPTATAVQPVSKQKLAKTPKPKADTRTPKIAVVPNLVDQNTLLPQPGAAPVQP
jgi:hypothetical protein